MGTPSRRTNSVTAIVRPAAAALTLGVAAATLIAMPASGGAPAPAATGSTEGVSKTVYFKSPSGNISCGLSRRLARCDISEYSYSPPPKPQSCDFEWGGSLWVRKRASFECVSDTVAIGDRVLEYGDSLRRGYKKCTSRRAGMVCRNLITGHGFRLSRYDVDRF